MTHKQIAGVFGASVLIAALIVGARAFIGSTYEYDMPYEFATSTNSTTTTNDERVVNTRTFTFADGETYAAPVESTGRQVLVFDRTLPANTFKIVRRQVPPLEIGGQTFDEGGWYEEVRYNEAAKVRPLITPANNGR